MKGTCTMVRVLLVDDSTVVRERIADLLSTLEGVEVVGQAADVPAGQLLIKELNPDMLVLDIDLPGQSGLELLKVVKKENPSIVVAILTNYDHPWLRKVCTELGANFFFHKPTEFEKTVDVCAGLRNPPEGAGAPF